MLPPAHFGRATAVEEEPLRPAAAAELVIVEDTREQRPLRFSPRVRVVRAALPAGDYAPQGFEGRAAIERKSLADLVGSVTRDRARFWRELERLRGYELRAVVVEACLGDVAEHRYRSQASPRSVLASALSVITDLGIPVVFAHDPDLAAECVEWMLRRFVRWQSQPGAEEAARERAQRWDG